MAQRFSSLSNFTSEVIFERKFTGRGLEIEGIRQLLKKEIIQEVTLGLFVWREPINKHNLKLIIITTPIYKNKLRSLQPRYGKVMEIIRESLQSNNFCDLSKNETKEIKSITNNSINFYDGPHLNSIGAKKFSREVALNIALDCNY